MNSELLTAAEIQDILHVDRSTVYRMAEDGRLPAIKVGRQWRFPATQFDAWLAAQGLSEPPAPFGGLPEAETLEALLPLECVQLIQDTFAETAGAMIVITDMTGKPITQVSNPCGLFAALQDSPQVWEQCVAHWRHMATTIDLEPRFTRSTLGLLCARGMIRTAAELKGIVFVGGFAPPDWPPDAAEIARMAADLDVDPAELAAHLHEVHTLADDKEAGMLLLVQRIANIVSHILHERGRLMAELPAARRA